MKIIFETLSFLFIASIAVAGAQNDFETLQTEAAHRPFEEQVLDLIQNRGFDTRNLKFEVSPTFGSTTNEKDISIVSYYASNKSVACRVVFTSTRLVSNNATSVSTTTSCFKKK